ncbi:Holliday junction resolvase RuvX [Labrys okinawensis]|uniref:Putative pre-16S rRNA nuclease n=1 Tax=Labrys okinawensis TaxID=346911 RepID=A0A2S9Q6P2_9HYPH|nr:Holliday junction resolvase RuvX [Labrys okinawensis]
MGRADEDVRAPRDISLIVDLFDLAENLPANQRLLGLDLGTKTIGLALSDVMLTIASPLETIRRTKFTADAEQLLALCARHEVGGLVLGYPLNMDGSKGPRAQASESFARNLQRLSDLPVALWDERLSTAAVTRTLLEADASRRRRAEVVDKMAASFILQGALDRLGYGR